ncbi:conjugal transfer transcriptional regulator TraJ [Diaphorobacter aerolatus]|uniref:Conjugal transfer transcriptional regulator TraJ n=1 Tax=Diaphorobacter aerolatus TaxID=1288495 RepID=A0A7H0GK48_9BURK|nr:conjugal transfer transcriptional regulator TraJ [Diaphorobacter aerolatus]QNP48664.1 conjugal transfer transcriptional regulator TraJ [Diaphorobacter aerolatus]
MGDEKQITRKGSPPIKVYCLPEERELIEANAKMAGISVARYLRDVGQGYQVKGVMDYHYVRELVRVNGDLGRRGGLLTLWLTDDPRTARFGDATILVLLGRIEATQDEMSRLMKSVVQPKAKP